MPIAIYLRVSTEEQRTRESIQTQYDFALRYCQLHQFAVHHVYADDVRDQRRSVEGSETRLGSGAASSHRQPSKKRRWSACLRATDTTFSQGGLTPGTTYYFGIEAQANGGQSSVMSNIAAATTLGGN